MGVSARSAGSLPPRQRAFRVGLAIFRHFPMPLVAIDTVMLMIRLGEVVHFLAVGAGVTVC